MNTNYVFANSGGELDAMPHCVTMEQYHLLRDLSYLRCPGERVA